MTSNRSASWALVALSALLSLCALGTSSAAAVAGQPATPASSAHASTAPEQDKDYFLIDSPDPIKGPKVEVVEVFGYGCPICAALQPRLVDWEKTLPADVHFSYLPAAFGADPEHCWDEFARAFYTAQGMGIQVKSHDAIYKAKFDLGRIATCEAIPGAYADYGANPKVFASTMHSFPVTMQISKAHDQALRWGVDGTPSIVVDGTYRVILTRSGGPTALLHAVDWLIAKQRPLHAHAGRPAKSAGKH